MKKKNPLIAGALNTILPGFSHVYVGRNLKGFISTFIGGVILIFLAITLANAIEDVKNYSILPGVCPAGLLLVILVPLFLKGMQTAQIHNRGIDSTAFYNQARQGMKGTQQSKLGQINKMRDEGLISKEEYEQKKDKVGEEKKAG